MDDSCGCGCWGFSFLVIFAVLAVVGVVLLLASPLVFIGIFVLIFAFLGAIGIGGA